LPASVVHLNPNGRWKIEAEAGRQSFQSLNMESGSRVLNNERHHHFF
jgi:hypothetical protein